MNSPRDGDPATIQTLLGDEHIPRRGLRSDHEVRLSSARTVTESSYTDLEGFVDGDVREDPYFVVDDDETVRSATFDVYKLLHHYLAALYSFNEAVRATVSAYLPDGVELDKGAFVPVDGRSTEYTRRSMFLRGVRVAFQHGAFNDCFPVERWDASTEEYRIGFDSTAFAQHEWLEDTGVYLRHTSRPRRKRPVKYAASFHTTNFLPFYEDCLAWFETY